jgi:hypothetical protein
VREAQAAYTKLGEQRADEILGPGGLSGASTEQLARLVKEAREIPDLKAGPDGVAVSVCCGAALNVTAIDRNLMRYPAGQLTQQGHLQVDPAGEFLEGVDWQDVEVRCRNCDRPLEAVVVDFDG